MAKAIHTVRAVPTPITTADMDKATIIKAATDRVAQDTDRAKADTVNNLRMVRADKVAMVKVAMAKATQPKPDRIPTPKVSALHLELVLLQVHLQGLVRRRTAFLQEAILQVEVTFMPHLVLNLLLILH